MADPGDQAKPPAPVIPSPYHAAVVSLTATACLLILAMIYLPPVHAKLAALGYPPGSFGLRYMAATLLGAMVGLAELALRYRDEPLDAATSRPGLVFVLLNGTASTLALFMVEYFGARVPPPGGETLQVSDAVQRVLVSGLGAMFVLRGRLLSIAGPGDTRTDIGFAPQVEEILAAVNRSIDRGRALERIDLVTRQARAMAPLTFQEVAPFLKVGLQALQTLDRTIQKTVADNIDRLEKDTAVASAVKFEAVGYDLLNNFGERAFETLFREARTSARLAKADAAAAGGGGTAGGSPAAGGAPQGSGAGGGTPPQGSGTAGGAPPQGSGTGGGVPPPDGTSGRGDAENGGAGGDIAKSTTSGGDAVDGGATGGDATDADASGGDTATSGATAGDAATGAATAGNGTDRAVRP